MTTVFVPCDHCGTEGTIYVRAMVYETGCGHAHIGEEASGECPVCHGRREVEIEVDPMSSKKAENEFCHLSQTLIPAPPYRG